MDENSTRDMTCFFANADKLRAAFGCCVLTIHHENALGNPRGNTAIIASTETAYGLKHDEKTGMRSLVDVKIKDLPAGGKWVPIDFRVENVRLPDVPDPEDPTQMLPQNAGVLVPFATAGNSPTTAPRGITETEKVVRAFAELKTAQAGTVWFSTNEIVTASGVRKETVREVLEDLRGDDRIVRQKKGQANLHALTEDTDAPAM
jgi:hypothetical protein